MNRFTQEEVKEIQRIFWRLEPQTLQSIQIYDESQMLYIGRTFGDPDRNRSYSYLFQNFANFTPGRKRIFEKMKKRLTKEPEVFKISEDIIRIVWTANSATAKF